MIITRKSKAYLQREMVGNPSDIQSLEETDMACLWKWRKANTPYTLYPATWHRQYNAHDIKVIDIEDISSNVIVKADEIFDIYLDNTLVERLPLQLCLLHSAIEKSKYILELGDDWDDEGSVGYSKETWVRAIRFLTTSSKELLHITSQVISAPNIYHGPDGSIDILWKTEGYRFLINIPVEPSQSASYYGDDYNLEKIQGTFDSRKSNIVILSILFQLVSNVADRINPR